MSTEVPDEDARRRVRPELTHPVASRPTPQRESTHAPARQLGTTRGRQGESTHAEARQRRTDRRRVALATAAAVPDLDDEGRLLADALRSAGLVADAAVWDDAAVNWAAYDLVVVRSTWDYPARWVQFLDWARRVEALTDLANEAALLAWNTDKRYLLELGRAGVPVVPTTVLEPGEGPDHPYGHVEHVVKPVVSAGSKDTLRFGEHDGAAGRDHARRLLDAGRGVLVQPYLASVDEHGETALVYLDGVLSHTLRKGPLLTPGMALVEGLFAQEEMRLREPRPEEIAVADGALGVVQARRDEAGLPGPPLYARVDLLDGEQGPVVLEVELTEPSLFLDLVPEAVPRMVEAIRRRSAASD